MLPSHRERLFQVQQESGLDFIQSLHEPAEYAPRLHHSRIVEPTTTASRADLNVAYHATAQPRTAHTSSLAGIPPGTSSIHATAGQNLGLDGIDSILDRYGLLQPGDMIDFYGPSCCGKTLYLYAIIISTILPRSWKYSKSKPAVLLNGKARSVIFLDMEQGFSVDRLRSLLYLEIIARLGLYEENEKTKAQNQPNNGGEKDETHDRQEILDVEEGRNIEQTGEREDNEVSREEQQYRWQESYHIDTQSPEMQSKIEQLMLSCLRNVHLFRPQDAISAIVILRTLDQYLASNTRVGSSSTSISNASPPFAILMIDSLSSFYWQERASNNHTRFTTVLIDALNRLVPRWKLIFISTTWSLPSRTLATDRTVTDALRARFRYRFLMQPRTLDRFDSEDDLVREWIKRQRERQQQKHMQRERGAKENVTGVVDNRDEYTGSVFQAQMLIPSVEHTRQELFRFSISDAAGVCSFNVPVQ
ncbi:DNA repair protein xrcc2 [Entomortierella chlamydospora]|uniref:DNA repair protein xrcc2 n=1 Tax=Entomortierella chlamydospora TaxID=101097 RepID=A0A9P6MS17_9FUNG|nr:DNA repair protein xrcc2 [Entomortierella chlamydospora]KAG0010654.1 DNA repair protein xrcc2 [Entomortierella chlamydospora]